MRFVHKAAPYFCRVTGICWPSPRARKWIHKGKK